MGEVGKFVFGGSTEKQKGRNSSQGQSSSQQSSVNQSAQVSGSVANNQNRSGGANYNQAYGPISAAMTSTLGYTPASANMMAALLGLPQSDFSYNQKPYAPGKSILPSAKETGAGSASMPDFGSLLATLAGAMPTPPTPPTPPAPTPGTPTTPPTGTGGSAPTQQAPWQVRQDDRATDRMATRIQFRELGGPVEAGKPYVVGEKRPELFVPNQSGTIVPQVPGMMTTQGGNPGRVRPGRLSLQDLLGNIRTPRGPSIPSGGTAPLPTPTPTPTPAPVAAPGLTPTSALEQFSDSAGMNFILDQGQKAISGASAANGVFNSGATGKALVNYGQGVGQTHLNQYMQHLMGLGQLGLGAGSAMSGAGGVGLNQSAGGGSSSSVSGGLSSGSSQGTSQSSESSEGFTSGSGSSKKGLVPGIASMLAAV